MAVTTELDHTDRAILRLIQRDASLSLAEIVVLWLIIASTIVAFWRSHRVAALLLVPYLAWESFATALTTSLWRLNPAAFG